MPLWLLHLTEGVEMCMMGQALKQWPKQSTNKGPRSSKGRYIMRETLQGKEKRNPMERILQHEKLKTVIKSWKDIFKNYSSQTLPRRDFFAKGLFSFVFLCFLIIFGLLQALSDPWKPSFSAHSLEIHCVRLFGPESFPRLGLGTKTCPYTIILNYN